MPGIRSEPKGGAGRKPTPRTVRSGGASLRSSSKERPKEAEVEKLPSASSSVQVVRRTLRILEALASANGALTLTELAKRVSLHPSTVLRILRTLADDGYITPHSKPPTWTLGPAFLRLKAEAGLRNPLREVARPYIWALSLKTGQTVHLGNLLDGEVCYLDKMEPPDQGVVIATTVGTRRPLHATALGKVLLAGLDPERLKKMVAQLRMVALTAHTITDRQKLLLEVDAVRARGFALDRRECNLVVQCAAAPIRDARSDVVAALSVSTIGLEIDTPEFEGIVKDIIATADTISRELGCPKQ